MHIAFVTHGSFDSHATLKRATGMATPLLEAGHEVTVLMQDSEANREKIMLECPEASVCWYPAGLNAFKERRYKQDFLNKLQPNLIWICAVGLRNWVFRPKKNTIMLADHSELFSHVGYNRLRRIFYWFVEWGHVAYFDGHVCASRYLEQFYKHRLRPFGKSDRVHYSPYAYHPGTMRIDLPGSKKLKRRFQERKPIVYMGSFWENYGFWDMLYAFRDLAQKRKDFVAVFIGRGPEKEKGIEWIQANDLEDVIHVEGYVAEEDLPAYFTVAYAFLSPLRDTIQDKARCPSKLFMYLPFKRPIITCRIGEAEELLGRQGYYFDPGNIESLTKKLDIVLNLSAEIKIADPQLHTYETRTGRFLKWYQKFFNPELQ